MVFKKLTNTKNIYILSSDILVTIISFWISFFLRSRIVWKNENFRYNSQYYNIIFIFILLIWFLLYSKKSSDDTFKEKYFRNDFFEIIVNNFYASLFIFTFIFLIKGFIISRVFLVLFILLNTIFLLIERRIFYDIRLKNIRKGKNVIKIILIGEGRRFEEFEEKIKKNPDWGITIVKRIKSENFDKNEIENIKSIPVDGIVIIDEKENFEGMTEQVTKLVESGINIFFELDHLFNLKKFFLNIEKYKEFNFLELASIKREDYQKLQLKYFLDRIFAIIFLILLSPIFFIISIVILLLNGKPVFFVQERVGLNGRTFKMFKFRTMEKDAENKKILLKQKNQMKGPVFKIMNDPRITPFGKFLRKYSLDELPQIINILKGEMSFVGPRPPLVNEVKEYDFWHRRRLSFKPGLTCLWQISGRNEIDFEEWMKKDLEYIDNWSLLYDMLIILKTIPVILKGNGW